MYQIYRGGSRRGSGAGPFWGTPKLHNEGKKTSHACMRKRRVLVLNSYPDPPPPLSEILYLSLSKNDLPHYPFIPPPLQYGQHLCVPH